MIELDFGSILLSLREAKVEFIVVGGISAALNGAPVQTYDVDIVHRRTDQNVDRILVVLESMDAVYRAQPVRRLRPVKSSLMSPGHQNLITTLGPLDLLGMIGADLGYDELLPHTTEMLIADGVAVRVLDLEMLIRVKEELGGEKDLAMLPLLRRTLRERGR